MTEKESVEEGVEGDSKREEGEEGTFELLSPSSPIMPIASM